jgi:hypothetical protein
VCLVSADIPLILLFWYFPEVCLVTVVFQFLNIERFWNVVFSSLCIFMNTNKEGNLQYIMLIYHIKSTIHYSFVYFVSRYVWCLAQSHWYLPLRMRNHMQQWFNPLISDRSGIDWWKNEGPNSRETVSLSVTHVSIKQIRASTPTFPLYHTGLWCMEWGTKLAFFIL